MTRALVWRFLAALVVVPTVALSAVPATAGELTVADTRGDLYSPEFTQTDDGQPHIRWTHAPAVRHGDIARVTFKHLERRVVIRSRYVDLVRGTRLYAATRFRDEDGKRAYVHVNAGKDRPGGTTALRKYRTGDRIRCSVSHRIDYATNTITVAFPRRCIGNPRTLAFTAVTESGGASYFDSAHGDRPRELGWSRRVRRG